MLTATRANGNLEITGSLGIVDLMNTLRSILEYGSGFLLVSRLSPQVMSTSHLKLLDIAY